MKKSVRISTLALAFMILLSLCLPVLATEQQPEAPAAEPVKLTIRPVRDGYTKRLTKKDVSIKALPGEAVAYTPSAIKGYTFLKMVDPATNEEVNLTNYAMPQADTLLYATYLKHQRITVKYVYRSGSKLRSASKETRMTLCPGESYTVEPKEIKGYTFLEMEDPNKGIAPNASSTVNLFYAKNVTATIKLVTNAKKAKTLADSIKLPGLSGQTYELDSLIPQIPGYEVASVSDPNKGVFGVKNHTITVKYAVSAQQTADTTGGTASTGTNSATAPANAIVKVQGYVVDMATGATLSSSSGTAVSGTPTGMPWPSLSGYTMEKVTINGTEVPLSISTYTPAGDTTIYWYVRAEGKATTSSVPAPGTYDETGNPTVETSAEAAYLLDCLNKKRGEAGLSPLAIDKTLNWCANVRAKECAVEYSHTRPDGRTCFTLHPLIKGENLGMINGSSTAAIDVLVDLWMDSPSHRANIMAIDFKTIGLSFYTDGAGNTYWAQNFGY